MKAIHSPHNPRIKRAIKLRTRRGRQQQQRFLIDGLREVERAVQAGVRISEVFICEQLLDAASLDRIGAWPVGNDTLVAQVPAELFAKIAFGDRAEGVLATAHYHSTELERLPVMNPTLVVVLDSVEKPGNLGAIARTAEAAGCDALIATGSGTDCFNPNAIRASTGAIFSLPIAMAKADEVCLWAGRHHLKMITCRPDAARSYDTLDLTQPVCLVLGSEAHGLGSEWTGIEIESMAVPMLGSVDSLNVSTTAAIVLYEARRQRSQ